MRRSVRSPLRTRDVDALAAAGLHDGRLQRVGIGGVEKPGQPPGQQVLAAARLADLQQLVTNGRGHFQCAPRVRLPARIAQGRHRRTCRVDGEDKPRLTLPNPTQTSNKVRAKRGLACPACPASAAFSGGTISMLERQVLKLQPYCLDAVVASRLCVLINSG